jgi:localization factor PodJL
MKSGAPWQLSGVTRQTRQAAREAARRAGMSVGEWLDSVIAQSTQADELQNERPAEYDDEHAYSAEREYREQDRSAGQRNAREQRDRQADDARNGRTRRTSTPNPSPHEHGPARARHHDLPKPDRSDSGPEGEDAEAYDHRDDAARRRAELEQTLPFAQEAARPAINKEFEELHARLDQLTRQLSQVATLSSGNAARRNEREAEPTRELIAVVSKLDRRLDQLIAEGRSSKEEIERQVNAVGRAVADLQREPARATAPADPVTPLEQALSEIADRQRALDGYSPSPPTPAAARATGSESLPRARTQELSGLEQQLRQINSQIEGLKPCGMDKAIGTLRDDLAEIGVMLQDAMPRKSVEALEREMRKLTERIDASRNAGADGAALASVEHGLAEVRDALRGLAPADNLPGVDRELHALSQKVDALAQNSQDPAALHQLESAIVGLRGVVSQVASNDALASLSDEVHALAGKVERASPPRDDGVLNALEERIGALADALAARNQGGPSVPHELEAVIAGLVDKIERVQLTRSDHTALGQLEDRIAKLVEKLDASDARVTQLEAIERGLAELLIHIEHQRSSPDAQAASAGLEIDALSRDLGDLRYTEGKTQESLELVHGTLGHVVDRLAMIETDMRRARTPDDGADRTQAWPSPPFKEAASAKPAAASRGPKSSQAQSSPKSLPAEPIADAQPLFRETPDAFTPLEEAGFQVEEGALRDRAPAIEGEASRSERRPLEPSLPPDHPLEPGSRDSRIRSSAAERIAASESALIGTAASTTAEPASASNFIAAARRAAQAASREKPARRDVSAQKEIGASGGKLAGRIRKLRALITGAAAFAIVVGGFQIVRTYLSDPAEPEVATPASPAETAAPASAQPPVPAQHDLPKTEKATPPRTEPIAPEKKPAGTESPIGRQSAAFPDASSVTALSSSMTVTPASLPAPSPTQPPTVAAPMPQTTASAAPAAEITGSIPPVAIAPRPLTTPPATPVLSPAERLPAAFAGSLHAAAAKNDAAAEYEIGARYADGRGVPQDAVAAAEWLERAAKQGLAPAQFRLGGMYEKGLGVKKNLETARRFYVAAGQAGNAKALHNLAVLYAEGIDGKPDYETAARWFRKAADYGIADSQYNLAILYARGIGVEQNPVEAYRWFALAARTGDAGSVRKRDELGSRLDPQSLSVAEQAVQTWSPHKQPAVAIEVKTPPGGWDQAAATPVAPTHRKPMTLGPKLDLATPRIPQ